MPILDARGAIMTLRLKAITGALFASLLIWAAVPAFAQSHVTATVDRTSLTTDESLILTVQVNTDAGSPSNPILPPFDGLFVTWTSSGQSISLINGARIVEATYHYRLAPSRTGDLSIAPITVSIEGQTYATEPIQISVTQGSGQPQTPQGSPGSSVPGFAGLPNLPGVSLPDWLFSSPGSGAGSPSIPVLPDLPDTALDPSAIPAELNGQDLFVDSTVDNRTPYQGEGLIHSFRFYQAVELYDSPLYEPPDFSGLWHETTGEPQVYTIRAGSRSYRVTEIQTALSPTVVGEVSIGPSRLSIPGGLFQNDQTLETRPIELDVLPLPPDAPRGFMGAVGRFDLSAEVDKTSVRLNDTVTLKMSLSGQGNLETVPDPAWTEGPEWRAYDSQVTVDTHIKDGKMAGARTYERLLVPTTPGDLVLSPIQYVYFNPQTLAYETTSTEAIAVRVAPESGPGEAENAQPGFADPAGHTAPSGVDTLRPNKTTAREVGGRGTPLYLQTGYWLLWGLPVLFLIGQLGWQTRQSRRLADPAARRSRAAARKARQEIKRARRDQANGEALASLILRGYLEDKLNRPLAGLTEGDLSDLLVESGLDPQLARRAMSCLALGEMSRYGPGEGASSQDRNILDAVDGLIEELENRL
jgi:BatD DUF11 like domain